MKLVGLDQCGRGFLKTVPVLEPGAEERSLSKDWPLQPPSFAEPPQPLPTDAPEEPPVAGLRIGTMAATDLIDGADSCIGSSMCL